MSDHDYAVRIERFGGSRNGDVIAIFDSPREAWAYINDPDDWARGCVLAIYILERWEDDDE